MHKLQVMFYHPLGGPLGLHAADKLEYSTHGYHDTMLKIGLQIIHKCLLLRGTQRHPYYVRTVVVDKFSILLATETL